MQGKQNQERSPLGFVQCQQARIELHRARQTQPCVILIAPFLHKLLSIERESASLCTTSP